MKTKNRKTVVHPNCLPSRSPLWPLAVIYLMLDKVGLPQWGWGVFFTLALLLEAGFLISRYKEIDDFIPGFGEEK